LSITTDNITRNYACLKTTAHTPQLAVLAYPAGAADKRRLVLIGLFIVDGSRRPLYGVLQRNPQKWRIWMQFF